ncbi:MAG TPA: hypothetical protein VJ824_14465 [Bacillota bacterium]|nr:hypothetical protein [Bacillota bacterium]
MTRLSFHQKNLILFDEKIEILKKYEIYCYQVTFFLLKKEKTAIEAATYSLFELSQDEEFFLLDDLSQKRRVKSLAMKNSVILYNKPL